MQLFCGYTSHSTVLAQNDGLGFLYLPFFALATKDASLKTLLKVRGPAFSDMVDRGMKLCNTMEHVISIKLFEPSSKPSRKPPSGSLFFFL